MAVFAYSKRGCDISCVDDREVSRLFSEERTWQGRSFDDDKFLLLFRT